MRRISSLSRVARALHNEDVATAKFYKTYRKFFTFPPGSPQRASMLSRVNRCGASCSRAMDELMDIVGFAGYYNLHGERDGEQLDNG